MLATEDKTEDLARLRQLATPKQAISNWLWFLVIAVGTIIATLWGYSIYNQISILNFGQSKEKQLFTQGQQSWEEAFKLTKNHDTKKELVKEKIAIIIQLLKNSATANTPTSASSTPTTATATVSTTLKQ